MAEKYQKALDLFKRIYFKNGNLDCENWECVSDESDKKECDGLEKKEYIELAYRIFKISKIKGKSVFTPKIIFRPYKHCSDGRGSFFLTLDQNSRFGKR